MEETLEDIESKIIRKLLNNIEIAKYEELTIYVSAYECFLNCIQSRKFIQNELG